MRKGDSMRQAFSVAALVATFDLFTKFLALNQLTRGQSIPVIRQLLSFDLVRNPGAAYGLLSGQPGVLAAITVGVMLGLFWYAAQARATDERLAVGLLLGGAAGNLINRILWGPVVDFIRIDPLVTLFQVFNLADIAVVGGAIGLAIGLLRQWRTEADTETG